MPIGPTFQKNRRRVGEEISVAVWGPVDPPETLRIRGSDVVVDLNLFTRCGVFLVACPAQMYELRQTLNYHPSDERGKGKCAFVHGG